MRIRWLRTALANLNAEAEYIARDNPAAGNGGWCTLDAREHIGGCEGFDVAKLNLALGRHLDVGGLQVPVNDNLFVSRSNTQNPRANVPPLLSS